jgi:hypothetical protein
MISILFSRQMTIPYAFSLTGWPTTSLESENE